MVHTAAVHDEGPIAFRYPRGEGTGVALPDRPEVLEIGRGRVVQEGSGVAILSFGAHLQECLKAARMLAMRGVSATVADARFAKPLDTALIDQLIRHHPALVTVEQGAEGGFGARVLHWLAANERLDRGLCIRTMTLPDRFIDQASPAAMYADAGLAPGDIVATCLDALGVVPGRFSTAASA
jgi:1-deoxy-D-xylulose-5-phosphate synthase